MQPLLPEQILMDSHPDWSGERFLVVSPGRSQLGWQIGARYPSAKVTAWYCDLYQANEARATAAEAGSNIDIQCTTDLPDDSYDAVFMPVLKRGEAELTRELMQQAHQRLKVGGYLAMAVDNPTDTWLHDQLRTILEKVTVQQHAQGRAYWGRKTGPLKRIRDFSCEFQFRDEDRMITAFSRPSVFSHRKLDDGARQLIKQVEIGPEDHVLDYGCGSGVVALACAGRTSGRVIGVDANSRAIECLNRGAQANGFQNIEPILNSDGRLGLSIKIDVALANPPYFGDQKIWQHFADACLSCLRVGGSLLMVTKQPNWFVEYLDPKLESLSVAQSGHYYMVHGWAL
jgi:16S rRNA (guanine1207-N2)-methyltransferase